MVAILGRIVASWVNFPNVEEVNCCSARALLVSWHLLKTHWRSGRNPSTVSLLGGQFLKACELLLQDIPFFIAGEGKTME